MSPPLFLVAGLPATDTVRLDGPEGHHAADVQRLRPGEELLLCDGQGGVGAAVVTAAGRGSLEIRLVSRRYVPPGDPRIVVVQGIAKGERGELAVQAMTEVGVDEIVPWAAARSVTQWRGERGERSLLRWRATAREAAKQSRRPWLPVVAPPVGMSALVPRLGRGTRALVLHERAGAALSGIDLPAAGEILLVVGPEGGIDPAELAELEAAGATPVRLGETVLRTSTAGVAALAVLAVRLGRW